MVTKRWTRADEFTVLHCCPSAEDKNIFFARKYSPGKGYTHSETNRLILNLKIPPSQPHRSHHKTHAIQKFADEVGEFLPTIACDGRSYVIVPIPCSRMLGDPEYDDRLIRVASEISQRVPSARTLDLFRILAPTPASHSTTSPRNPNQIYSNLKIDFALTQVISEEEIIVVLDDVITSGAHFEAVRRSLSETLPQNEVIGVFWAKSEK